jgi:hypothetical protein
MSNFDTSIYQPPGIFIGQEQAPIVGNIGLAPNLLAIVGPSVGYRTQVESITLPGTTDVALSRAGIDEDTITVTDQTGAPFDVDVDYEVTVTGSGATATTEVTRLTDGDIEDGESIRVTYQYTDSAYFEPLRVSAFGTVRDSFGSPIDPSSGAITSPLSFAAKIAFDNGASEMVLLATEGTPTLVTRTEISDAYPLIETLIDVGIVVPLPVGITGTSETPGDTKNIATDLANHVDAASAGGDRRVGIVGLDKAAAIPPNEVAAAVGSQRVSVVHPNVMQWYNGFANQTVEVSGYYLAAAAAGRMAALPIPEALTKKRIFGFTGVPPSVLSTMTKTTKDAWSRGGVSVLEPDRQNRLSFRHFLSTNMQSVLTREVSVTRARDEMMRLITGAVEGAELIGTPIVADTPLRVQSVVDGALQTAVSGSSPLIVDYTGLTARIAQIDPSVIEVRFSYRPAYPLNYISIVFTIDTTSGTIEEAA